MPQLNANQFRTFSIERSVAAKNESDPYSHARGFQNYSSNLYAPAFSGEYNAGPEENRSSASAYDEEEED